MNVRVERVMTDNGSPFVGRPSRAVCAALNAHKKTRPYTPRTNGKVERFIQTLLREWAYRFKYNSSAERKRWLPTSTSATTTERIRRSAIIHPIVVAWIGTRS